MSTTQALLAVARRRPAASSLPALARLEIARYLRHPLFWVGVLINIALCIPEPDARSSVMLDVITPAAGIGVLGIIIAASLTREAEVLSSAGGVVPVPERTRTIALVSACVVPFTAGLLWWAWALITYHQHPPTPNGFPFGAAGSDWAATVLFAEGPLACLGGPLLGIVVGHWLRGRAAPALTAVGVIAASIVMQGIFEPLRRVRVIMPWTYWGGPLGIHADANRELVLPGSPYWWTAYVGCLCALAMLAGLLHDRESDRRPLLMMSCIVGVLALATVILAMWTGIPHTLINPRHS